MGQIKSHQSDHTKPCQRVIFPMVLCMSSGLPPVSSRGSYSLWCSVYLSGLPPVRVTLNHARGVYSLWCFVYLSGLQSDTKPCQRDIFPMVLCISQWTPTSQSNTKPYQRAIFPVYLSGPHGTLYIFEVPQSEILSHYWSTVQLTALLT